MRTASYTLLSRLRHSSRYYSSSQCLLFHYADTKFGQNDDRRFSQNAPFSSSSTHTQLGHRRLFSSAACSKRFVLLHLLPSDGVHGHHYQQRHLFHRSRFLFNLGICNFFMGKCSITLFWLKGLCFDWVYALICRFLHQS